MFQKSIVGPLWALGYSGLCFHTGVYGTKSFHLLGGMFVLDVDMTPENYMLGFIRID